MVRVDLEQKLNALRLAIDNMEARVARVAGTLCVGSTVHVWSATQRDWVKAVVSGIDGRMVEVTYQLGPAPARKKVSLCSASLRVEVE